MSNDPHTPDPDAPERRPRRPLTLTLIVGAAAVGGLLMASYAAAAAGWFGGWRHGHSRGECGEHGFDAERARDHAGFATDWMLRHIDASKEQEESIEGIVSSLIGEVGGLVEPHREGREDFLAWLADQEIDRSRLEDLRQRQIAMADSASRLLADAIADIAEVLTPEQRAELLEDVQNHHGHRRHWR